MTWGYFLERFLVTNVVIIAWLLALDWVLPAMMWKSWVSWLVPGTVVLLTIVMLAILKAAWQREIKRCADWFNSSEF